MRFQHLVEAVISAEAQPGLELELFVFQVVIMIYQLYQNVLICKLYHRISIFYLVVLP